MPGLPRVAAFREQAGYEPGTGIILVLVADHTAKYNQLVCTEREWGAQAGYAGREALGLRR
ncbi:hypothetical protein [Streptomyces antibioticus]|uniref:hypothetical protein n=1 Tax=Streptomyces antibioticus TaxID=1890 RepID=UPI003D73C2DC